MNWVQRPSNLWPLQDGLSRYQALPPLPNTLVDQSNVESIMDLTEYKATVRRNGSERIEDSTHYGYFSSEASFCKYLQSLGYVVIQIEAVEVAA